jgi:hypothetical protein
MPKWADVVLVPLISLIIAALLSALLILAIGESPVAALKLMIEGTLLRSSGWGYMLYYTTNFIFTGLAVSVAFHAALFNIGGEGQADDGRAWCGAGLPVHSLASLDLCNYRRLAGCGLLWYDLGWASGLFAGQTRQSYRHHNHHVQFYCRRGFELFLGRRAEA